MGKKYNWAGALQSQYLKVTDSTPLDDRSVVESRNDLLNENTWVVENTRCTYSGMIAAVVDDPIEDNNGIYYLRRSSKYNKQSWDSTLENYNIEGWRKLSSGSGGNLSNILWITFTKSTHTNGPITCSATYSEITTAINSGYLVIGMYQPNIQGYYKQYFTIPTNINTDTLLFANQSPNDANEVLFITMTAQETTLTITKDYAIPDVANNNGKILVANAANDSVTWQSVPTQVNADWNANSGVAEILNKPTIPAAQVNSDWNANSGVAQILNKPAIPTLRTMNHEQLTDSSLGNINIHDGYYFPNAVQDYDGNWYGAVVIGDQVWLAENIKTTHMPDGTPIINGSASANNDTAIGDNQHPYYYWVNDDESTKDSYGLLYNVNAIMDNETASSTNPSGVQGISPDGWHIPSDSEYQQLLEYVTKQKRFDYPNHLEYGYDYYTNALTREDYNNGTIGGDPNKINATGFNFFANPPYLPTSNSYDLDLGTGFDYNESMSIIMVYDGIGIDLDEIVNIALNNDCPGINVRCVSDLKPVQFRNWYTQTYGTMQHHLVNNAPDEVFWCHFTRANKVITQMDKTIDEIYQAYTEGKLIMCESLAANDSQFYSLVSCSQNTIVFGCALSQEATTASRFHFVIGTKVSNVDTWIDDYSEYQAKLISGVTIKTINGNSILGNGNLTIQSVPTPTSADEGKLLSVDSNGEYELITIVNSENIEY